MAMSSRRLVLRHHTSRAHGALDETVGGLDSLPRYRWYLRSLHAFREPAERLVARCLASDASELADVRPTRIAELLQRDMADLDVSPAPPATLVVPTSPSGLAGLVYVLEGSALGARLLRRQAAGIGLDDDRGARHLAAQADSLEAWQGFLFALDRLSDFDEAEAIASAGEAFAAARLTFTRLDADAEALHADIGIRG